MQIVAGLSLVMHVLTLCVESVMHNVLMFSVAYGSAIDLQLHSLLCEQTSLQNLGSLTHYSVKLSVTRTHASGICYAFRMGISANQAKQSLCWSHQ